MATMKPIEVQLENGHTVTYIPLKNTTELLSDINFKLDRIIEVLKENKSPMMTIDNTYIPTPIYKS